MIVKDLKKAIAHEAWAFDHTSPSAWTANEDLRKRSLDHARDAVIAFLSVPLPTCACGMFRAGQTFENWSRSCTEHFDGQHDPRPRYA